MQKVCKLGKVGPKIGNCFFKVNFDTKTNSNMQNSMVLSILCFRLKIATRFYIFGAKNRNCQFQLKVGT